MSGEDVTARFRRATAADLPDIVALIADDGLGRGRERPTLPLDTAYIDAFDAIEADPNQIPLVAERDGELVGYLQISLIPGISRGGAWRGQLESIRIASELRGRGLGTRFVEHAIGLCRERGCGLVQLTTDVTRADARRFYDRLGFEASHHGMKRAL